MSIKIMARVWEDESITDRSELLTLLALADWANDRGECDPSYNALAAKVRVQRRYAIGIVGKLTKRGILAKDVGEGFKYGPHSVSNRIRMVKHAAPPSVPQDTPPSVPQDTPLVSPGTPHYGQRTTVSQSHRNEEAENDAQRPLANGDEHPHGEPEPSGLPSAVGSTPPSGSLLPDEGSPTAPAARGRPKAKATPSPRSAPPPSPWDAFYGTCAQARGEKNGGIGVRTGRVLPWIGAMAGTAGAALRPPTPGHPALGQDMIPVAALYLFKEWHQDLDDFSRNWVRRCGDPQRIVSDFMGWCASPRGRKLARETVADLAAFAASQAEVAP